MMIVRVLKVFANIKAGFLFEIVELFFNVLQKVCALDLNMNLFSKLAIFDAFFNSMYKSQTYKSPKSATFLHYLLQLVVT